MAIRCLLLCKDKNFKANHNIRLTNDRLSPDVCYYAKIRILKQITTCFRSRMDSISDVCYYAKIRILKQITTYGWIVINLKRCLLLCKDKNFKANHNSLTMQQERGMDVCYYAKIRILKQITTWFVLHQKDQKMFVTMQR